MEGDIGRGRYRCNCGTLIRLPEHCIDNDGMTSSNDANRLLGQNIVDSGIRFGTVGMERETLRQHIDKLEDKYVTVRKRMETQDRWVTLSSAGEDYAREHGMM